MRAGYAAHVAIEIANESGVELDTDAVMDVARHTLAEIGVNPLAELAITLVDTEYMAELNHRWMDGDGPTDVLAFPLDEPTARGRGPEDDASEPTLLGDVVLCPEVARRQAASAGHSTADEVALLTVHGTLHLLGYDHAEPEEEREMFGLQAQLLDSWRTARTG